MSGGLLRSEGRALVLALAMLGALTAVAIASRPLLLIDETRYVGVAWEMWLRGDFLVPFKNGAPYSHKPPLMMWLFQSGWAIFGVNQWWPRLISPLISAINLLLTVRLARRLWPDRADIGGTAILILASCLLWTVFSTMAMFDILLALFTLMGMHGTLLTAEGKTGRGTLLLGVAIGLGILAKGPVILVHVLPATLLTPWWNPGLRWPRWSGGILGAVVIGAAIALAWAVPAGLAGGAEYRQAIFWGQTARRMAESFAHRHPVWWYLPHLPLMFFPWAVWPDLWHALNRFVRKGLDRGGRFCLAWMLPVIVVFSFISGKQMQYLLPVFPAFALLAARAIADEEDLKGLWLPVLVILAMGGGVLALGRKGAPLADVAASLALWPVVLLILAAFAAYLAGRRMAKPVVALAWLGVALTASVQLAYFHPLYAAYDIRPMGEAIHQAQLGGHVVAHDGTYHNQYQFAGRLQAPLVEIESTEELVNWLAAHPDGYAVVYAKNASAFRGVKTIAWQRYRGRAVALLDAPSATLFLREN